MHKNVRRLVAAAIALGLTAAGARARPAGIGENAEPPVYELSLVYIFETPETEFVFVIGNSGFKSVPPL
ncbi:MAG TPA: hypothetical protein VIY96_07270 [Thermoanaerobaculia bacterium]